MDGNSPPQQTSYLLAHCEEAKLRAKNMAEMFNYKINYFRNAAGRSFKFEIKHVRKLLLLVFLPFSFSLALVQKTNKTTTTNPQSYVIKQY
jgi:hypothetical protein